MSSLFTDSWVFKEEMVLVVCFWAGSCGGGAMSCLSLLLCVQVGHWRFYSKR